MCWAGTARSLCIAHGGPDGAVPPVWRPGPYLGRCVGLSGFDLHFWSLYVWSSRPATQTLKSDELVSATACSQGHQKSADWPAIGPG